MFITMELSFQCIENEAFVEFFSIVAPSLNVFSLATLACDIFKLWDTKKANLENFISQNCCRVCLTADMWTSSQKSSYMCMTAHFIDNN